MDSKKKLKKRVFFKLLMVMFLIKKEFFFKLFNSNVVMHYPTICAHFTISLSNNSVAPLTINKSSYIMTIMKPNNMTYHYQPQQKQKKKTFLHSGRVWVWVRDGCMYLCYPSRTRILKSGKAQVHTQTQLNRGKPVKLGLVWVGTHEHGFCFHVYIQAHTPRDTEHKNRRVATKATRNCIFQP